MEDDRLEVIFSVAMISKYMQIHIQQGKYFLFDQRKEPEYFNF